MNLGDPATTHPATDMHLRMTASSRSLPSWPRVCCGASRMSASGNSAKRHMSGSTGSLGAGVYQLALIGYVGTTRLATSAERVADAVTDNIENAITVWSEWVWEDVDRRCASQSDIGDIGDYVPLGCS